MRIRIDASLRYLVEICRIKGEGEVTFLGETLTGSVVREKILANLREKGFSGEVEFDGELVKF
jgi:hypothetical protein